MKYPFSGRRRFSKVSGLSLCNLLETHARAHETHVLDPPRSTPFRLHSH